MYCFFPDVHVPRFSSHQKRADLWQHGSKKTSVVSALQKHGVYIQHSRVWSLLLGIICQAKWSRNAREELSDDRGYVLPCSTVNQTCFSSSENVYCTILRRYYQLVPSCLKLYILFYTGNCLNIKNPDDGLTRRAIADWSIAYFTSELNDTTVWLCSSSLKLEEEVSLRSPVSRNYFLSLEK